MIGRPVSNVADLKRPATWDQLVPGTRVAVSGQSWNYYDEDWYEGKVLEVLEDVRQVKSQEDKDALVDVVTKTAVVAMDDQEVAPQVTYCPKLSDMRAIP